MALATEDSSPRIPSTEKELIALYRTPGHPIAFSAPSKIYRYFRGRLSREFIKDALEKIDAYTLHREYKRPRIHNPYYSYVRRKNFQADLISIAALKEANDSVCFLNLIIDVFTRKIWIVPQKDKSAKSTTRAMLKWLDSMGEDSNAEKQLLTDRGKEYRNNELKAALQERSIRHDFTQNIHKCAIAERANKTIQVLIYKYLTDKGKNDRYIDVLGDIVRSYNKRPHRTLGNHSPNFADKKSNELFMRSLHLRRYAERERKRGRKRTLTLGDKVRVKTYGTGISTARRAYLQQFKGELFIVTSINTILPVPLYHITAMDDDEAIEGGFYSNELQRVGGDAFKVERVLRERGEGENKEYFVKWLYFSPRWNSWVKATDFE